MGTPQDEPERGSDEGPQRRVEISYSLAVGRYAVTFDEWDFAQRDPEWERVTGLKAYSPDDREWGRGDRPVINVSWLDAQAYTKWLSVRSGVPYRLLSEAEWEYACRTGTGTPFWWGTAISPDQANYNGSAEVYEGGGTSGEYRRKTLPVRSSHQIRGVYTRCTAMSGNGWRIRAAKHTLMCQRMVMRFAGWPTGATYCAWGIVVYRCTQSSFRQPGRVQSRGSIDLRWISCCQNALQYRHLLKAVAVVLCKVFYLMPS